MLLGIKVFCILLLLGSLVPVNGSLMSGMGLKANDKLIDLNEDNWRSMLKGEWVVEFYAPWCPACKNLAPTWERYASIAADFNVKVAKIDVTTSPSLSGRFFVTALPTIYHVIDGVFRQYRGSRDADALIHFIKQKQWQKIEPISSWKKPDTLHMSLLSYFFKLSHTLKILNTRFQEDYGLPTWCSYALFALGTIFVGATLGLLLVCIVDFLYPPKRMARQSFTETKARETPHGVEDIANDEIEDETANEDVESDNEDNDREDDEQENNPNDVTENLEQVEEKVVKNTEEETDKKEKEKDKTKDKKGSPNVVTASPTDVRKRKSRKAD